MNLMPKKGTVYVVDDDEAVRDSLQWLLEGKDYRVRCFDSAESFLARYDPREVACLIVDIRMGGMTGLELQDRLIERKSPLAAVIPSDGGGQNPTLSGTVGQGHPAVSLCSLGSYRWETSNSQKLLCWLDFARRSRGASD